MKTPPFQMLNCFQKLLLLFKKLDIKSTKSVWAKHKIKCTGPWGQHIPMPKSIQIILKIDNKIKNTLTQQ